MRSVSTVRNTFLKSSLSILFRLLHFPVPRFPPLQSGAAFSSPAFSTPAFLLLPRFPVPRFQRPRHRSTVVLCRQTYPVEKRWNSTSSTFRVFTVAVGPYTRWSEHRSSCLEQSVAAYHVCNIMSVFRSRLKTRLSIGAFLDCNHDSYCCVWEVTLSLSDTLFALITYLLKIIQ